VIWIASVFITPEYMPDYAGFRRAL
jgi:hypothetical protein